MKNKYKTKYDALVDLSERKNIKIIPLPEKDEKLLDSEIDIFKRQLEIRSKESEDFYKYYIEKQLQETSKISEGDFNQMMKNIIKEHKILKSLLKEQEN